MSAIESVFTPESQNENNNDVNPESIPKERIERAKEHISAGLRLKEAFPRQITEEAEDAICTHLAEQHCLLMDFLSLDVEPEYGLKGFYTGKEPEGWFRGRLYKG